MKQSDVFSIIIIATVGTLAAYFAVNSFLGDPNMQSVRFKTIESISSSLADPDPELFNSSAINPTVEVYVGDCEDVDRNGILSKEELIACGEITEEEAEEVETFTCLDGTEVLDVSTCPENQNNGNNGNSGNNSNENSNSGDE